jgi:hypothetical protein
MWRPGVTKMGKGRARQVDSCCRLPLSPALAPLPAELAVDLGSARALFYAGFGFPDILARSCFFRTDDQFPDHGHLLLW